MKEEIRSRSIDVASQAMLLEADKAGLEVAWDRLEKQQPQCGFGELGLCCRNCNMGPCRIDPFGEGPTRGVCGATADIMVARGLLRMIAAGAQTDGRGQGGWLRDQGRGQAAEPGQRIWHRHRGSP
jgi:carbon-monoxide dehydrogenase catalytic subunit